MSNSIAQRVISVISVTQDIPADCISLESTRFSLGIDSLDALNVIFNLEKEFEMRIRNEGIMYAGNVAQIAEMIEQKLVGATNGLEVEV